MRPIRPGIGSELAGDGEGQSCALIVAQAPGDPGGWLCELHANAGQGFFLVRRFWLTAPLRVLSRVVATCTFPRARTWKAIISAPTAATQSMTGALMVSDQPYALGEQDHGQPGARGWSNAGGVGAGAVVVPPGAKIQEVSCVGGVVASSVRLTVPRDARTSQLLPLIPVDAAEPFYMPKETLASLQGPATVTFTSTARHLVVYME